MADHTGAYLGRQAGIGPVGTPLAGPALLPALASTAKQSRADRNRRADPVPPPGIQITNGPLYRVDLLKAQLRAIFQARNLATATKVLIGWLAWAQRCRLEPFVKLAKTIKRYRKLMLGLCLPRPD